MILWPAGLAVIAVWLVFADPAIDYRLVVVGAVAPDLVDGVAVRGIWVLHTLVASVVLLAVVMLATTRRRHARRRLLAVPIGTFLHLVVDGMWARTSQFWWPGFGWRLSGRLPALSHGPAVLVVEELLGALALLWCWNRFGFASPSRRAKFARTGRLTPQGDGAPPATAGR